MNPLPGRILEIWSHSSIIKANEHILVAVSGGSDSVALLHILYTLRASLNLTLSVAHFHHGLRGKPADEDANFVMDLAEKMGLPHIVEKGDVALYKKQKNVSTQQAARELRYSFLERTRCSIGADKAALGHTRNDQMEELLLRLVRGVGPDGLSGMPAVKHPCFIRPLLSISREELRDFLEERNAAFREDQSNLDCRYLRNRIRHKVLPLFREMNPRFDEVTVRLFDLVLDDRNYFDQSIGRLWHELIHYECRDCVVIDRTKFIESHPAIAGRILRKAISSVAGTTASLLRAHVQPILESVRHWKRGTLFSLPHSVCVNVSYGEIAIFSREVLSETVNQVVRKPGHFTWGLHENSLTVSLMDTQPDDLEHGPWHAVIDRQLITWPLTVRTPLSGDRMRPFGLKGTKKLTDIFINRKIPLWKRRLLPLLESQGSIIWVAGIGPSDLVRITRQTEEFLEIRYSGMLTAFPLG